MSKRSKAPEPGNYVQVYLYKLPKKNHDALVKLLKRFTKLYAKHGTLAWEFFQLNKTDVFEGLTSIAKTLEARMEEEVWVEVDRFRDFEHRNSTLQSLVQDPEATPLFNELVGLISQGFSVVMGDFDRLEI